MIEMDFDKLKILETYFSKAKLYFRRLDWAQLFGCMILMEHIFTIIKIHFDRPGTVKLDLEDIKSGSLF